ncbi:MAG: hypothetical protein CM15mL7_020 [uncultured marine virus]|nr:MAG: hypothetical protein CM15mL7_020 [uncultured marine virus]
MLESRILISGPTVQEKELVARKIHNHYETKTFRVINAASLKEKLTKRELFGQEFEMAQYLLEF